ncbi:hypothetical protein [Peribacillus aracenensis]|uniref:hypothetical protein n=1 Tax=Peribacillus aracenensis TaxID=2976708 RepID=UPI0021A4EC1F|nr:hypothetical protein [Peribacillus sp. BBB004]
MDATDNQVAAEDNKCLGALILISDESITVQSGNKSSIDLGFPSFPSNMIKEIAHAEIKSFVINF